MKPLGRINRYLLLLTAGLGVFLSGCKEEPKNALHTGPLNTGPLFPFLTIEAPHHTGSRLGTPIEERAKWGYMDSTGAVVIQPTYSHATPFDNGAAAVQFLERKDTGVFLSYNSSWGVIDRGGNLVVKPKFDHIAPFHEGLARAMLGGKGGKRIRSGYIDETGTFLISWDFSGGAYYAAGEFSEGLARIPEVIIAGKKAKYGYIDKEGTTVIEPQFGDCGEFSEGLAYAKPLDEELYGFIDTNGTFELPPQYEAVKDFSEGLAAVKINGKYGFIDTAGNLQIPARFTDAGWFSEGLAAVAQQDEAFLQWGFIDKTGSLIIPYTYYNWEAPRFEQGLALVQIMEKTGSGGLSFASGYINRENEWIYDPVEGPWWYYLE